LTNPKDFARPDEDEEERERDKIDPVEKASAEVMATRKYLTSNVFILYNANFL